MARKTKKSNKLNFDLMSVSAMNERQKNVLSSDNNQVLFGSAGTGKTFLATYLALKGLLNGDYERILFIRSAVSTRDIGFLPGTEKEKMAVYETPCIDNCNKLLQNGSAYEVLKLKGIISFAPTSFVRGTEFRNTFVIVDECQNMTFHELDSLITRLDDDSTIIFCGDTEQSDLNSNGFFNFMQVLEDMYEFDSTEFSIEDVVRSGLVKSYLRAKSRFNNKD